MKTREEILERINRVEELRNDETDKWVIRDLDNTINSLLECLNKNKEELETLLKETERRYDIVSYKEGREDLTEYLCQLTENIKWVLEIY